MLTVGSKITGRAIDLDIDGKGVVKYEEYVLFVNNLLKDELAEIKIEKIKKNIAFGRATKIIEKSKDRKDENYALGSLDLYHLKDNAQLVWQKQVTKVNLEKVLKKSVDVCDTITDSNFYHYRNKAVFHVLKESTIKLGLFKEQPIELIEVNDFILVSELVNRLINKINSSRIENSQSLKHVVFRVNDKNNVLVTLVSDKKIFKGLHELIEILQTFKEVVGITVNIKKVPSVIISDESYLIYGKNELTETLGNQMYYMSDQTFFQVNRSVAKLAYDKIKEYVNKDDIVIDCYSGVGSIGFYIKDKVKKVLMVEIQKANVEYAKKIKEEFNIRNVKIIHGDVLLEKDKIKDANTIILDPPKSGLSGNFVTHLLKEEFSKIIYMSCDLKTLTRDLRLLDNLYDIIRVYPVRMFPQTTSIETLVILNKR